MKQEAGHLHQKNKMGNVELATVSFGQSFQITPIQLAATVSGIINGGKRVTPHFAVAVQSPDGRNIKELSYPVEQGVVCQRKPPGGCGTFWKR